METYQHQSLGEPISIEPCGDGSETGETPMRPGELLEPLNDDCACEQSVYWANVAGYNCEDLNICISITRIIWEVLSLLPICVVTLTNSSLIQFGVRIYRIRWLSIIDLSLAALGLMRAERLEIGQWPILAKEPGCRADDGMKKPGI